METTTAARDAGQGAESVAISSDETIELPSQFLADCADLSAELGGLAPEDRLDRFRNRAREIARWIRIKGLPAVAVADRLTEIADVVGLNADLAQAAVADAIARPAETPKVKGANSTTKLASFDWRKQVSTAAQLQHQIFPPVAYIVPGILPEGLEILAGKPKIGKSWLALDLCLAVASGRHCLGEIKPSSGAVLYAALEDNRRRLQRRITKLLGVAKEDWPKGLALATQWRRLDKGGVDDLAEWIDTAADPRLIVLDTLAGVRPIKTNASYLDDYESLAALQRLANDRGVAILVLHHTRKMEADDPIDTVSGTLGLAGCADTVLVLTRSSKGTTLYVRGRDIEEAEHAVEFQKESCRWTILGDAAAIQRSAERSRILGALGDSTEPMGPTDIAGATGMKPNNVKFLLHKMLAAGEIKQPARGQYVVG